MSRLPNSPIAIIKLSNLFLIFLFLLLLILHLLILLLLILLLLIFLTKRNSMPAFNSRINIIRF
ncbi:MAG: hypothetical protein EGQ79_03575 [Ruminococcus sp.]|nr:hypothetical protein [Ruminococcus sp.]